MGLCCRLLPAHPGPPAALLHEPPLLAECLTALQPVPKSWDASSFPTNLNPRGETVDANHTEGPCSRRSDPRELGLAFPALQAGLLERLLAK